MSRELDEAHGGCRIVTDVGSYQEDPPYLHFTLYAGAPLGEEAAAQP